MRLQRKLLRDTYLKITIKIFTSNCISDDNVSITSDDHYSYNLTEIYFYSDSSVNNKCGLKYKKFRNRAELIKRSCSRYWQYYIIIILVYWQLPKSTFCG